MDESTLRSSLREALPGWGGLVLGTSFVLWLPFCAANRLFEQPGDAGLLLLYLVGIHGALFAVSTAAVLLAGRGGATGSGRILGAGLGALIAVNLVLRFPALYGPLNSRDQPFVTPLGAVGLVVALAAPWALCERRRSAIWGVAFAVTLALLLAAEVPPKVDLGNPADTPGTAQRAQDVVLLGFDGLSWNLLLPLAERGELPHFAGLLERGARGTLITEIPTLSPRIWTTIATGRPPPEHGIHGFSKFLLPGIGTPVGRGPVLSTPNWWNGLNRLLLAARNRGWIDDEPYFSWERRVPAIWDLADHHGLSTGMAGWLASWPVAAPTAGGFRVSDFGPRPGSRVPETELTAAAPDGLPPSDDPFVSLVWHETHSDVQRTVELWERFTPRLTTAYFRFPDPLQHHAWRGSRFLLGRGVPELERLPAELPASYRLLDRWLGRWLEAVGPERLVVLVSDHGFCFDGRQHHRAPPGVLVMAGPGVRPGSVVEGATIYDIVPTLAALLELPVPSDLSGRALAEGFAPGTLPELRRTGDDSWYRPRARRRGTRSRQFEDENLERLRSLGYVN